jgi:hypothetical protein
MIGGDLLAASSGMVLLQKDGMASLGQCQPDYRSYPD